MKTEIGDDAAIVFAVGFYKALGAGRSVEEAYKFGLVELQLLGIPENLTPTLIRKRSIRIGYINEIDPSQRAYYAFFKVDDRTILIDPNACTSFKQMLDELYIHYFVNSFPPFTYGSRWIIGPYMGFGLILAPWEWILNQDRVTIQVQHSGL